jgi:hypothetical protein
MFNVFDTHVKRYAILIIIIVNVSGETRGGILPVSIGCNGNRGDPSPGGDTHTFLVYVAGGILPYYAKKGLV